MQKAAKCEILVLYRLFQIKENNLQISTYQFPNSPTTIIKHNFSSGHLLIVCQSTKYYAYKPKHIIYACCINFDTF